MLENLKGYLYKAESFEVDEALSIFHSAIERLDAAQERLKGKIAKNQAVVDALKAKNKDLGGHLSRALSVQKKLKELFDA